jgi:hypothetical protein
VALVAQEVLKVGVAFTPFRDVWFRALILPQTLTAAGPTLTLPANGQSSGYAHEQSSPFQHGDRHRSFQYIHPCAK